MQTEEIIKWLSDNHRLLIIGGGIICFISLFLPFWHAGGIWYNNYGGTSMGWQDISISGTLIFWLFLILIVGIYYGFYRSYGEMYTHLYLAIGIGLLLLTLYAYQYEPGEFIQTSNVFILNGFYLELIGSIAVSIGGYYYYENRKTP